MGCGGVCGVCEGVRVSVWCVRVRVWGVEECEGVRVSVWDVEECMVCVRE